MVLVVAASRAHLIIHIVSTPSPARVCELALLHKDKDSFGTCPPRRIYQRSPKRTSTDGRWLLGFQEYLSQPMSAGRPMRIIRRCLLAGWTVCRRLFSALLLQEFTLENLDHADSHIGPIHIWLLQIIQTRYGQ